MAEGHESGYEADWESYEADWESNDDSLESGNEADCESNDDWPEEESECVDSIETYRAHRKHTIYQVVGLTVGVPFRQTTEFETKCSNFVTAWQSEIELEREKNGSVSYTVTNKRTDAIDRKLDAAVWVRIQCNKFKLGFFHREKFERKGMMPGDEIRASRRDVVSADQMETLPNNELVLHVDMVAKGCHRNAKRKRESDSSNDYPMDFYKT